MSFFVRNVMGSSFRNVDDVQIREILASLRAADAEHPDVALEHESGWALTYLRGGLLVYENVEESDVAPRHMVSVEEAGVLALWKALAAGDFERIENEPWLPGYGP